MRAMRAPPAAKCHHRFGMLSNRTLRPSARLPATRRLAVRATQGASNGLIISASARDAPQAVADLSSSFEAAAAPADRARHNAARTFISQAVQVRRGRCLCGQGPGVGNAPARGGRCMCGQGPALQASRWTQLLASKHTV